MTDETPAPTETVEPFGVVQHSGLGPLKTLMVVLGIIFLWTNLQGWFLFGYAWSINYVNVVTGSHYSYATVRNDGFLVSLTTCIWTPLAFILLCMVAGKKGLSYRTVLAMNPVPIRSYLIWTGWFILFICALEIFVWAVKLPDPGFIITLIKSAMFPPLLWVAVGVAAPIFEEALFRGYLFAGILHSRAGGAGAIAGTSALWALIHVPYGWPYAVIVLALGIFLGVVRLRSGSLYPCIALHILNNLLSLLMATVLHS